VRTSQKIQEAIYIVVELIVKGGGGGAHTTAKTLLIPACKEMVKITLELEAVTEISGSSSIS
jgi:hypothetical protein